MFILDRMWAFKKFFFTTVCERIYNQKEKSNHKQNNDCFELITKFACIRVVFILAMVTFHQSLYMVILLLDFLLLVL